MRLRLAAAVVVAVLAAPAAAAGEPGVEELRLENGLTVLLRPIEGAQIVALVTLFSIGEAHDPADACGTAHLLEHLYVTAAAGKLPARTAQQFMRSYAGRLNAQTGRDYTVVATVFPKEDLPAELDEAAARMGDLRIEASDLEREVPRVLRELELMYQGPNPALAVTNHAANAAWDRVGRPHGGDPAKVPTIGLDTVRARWKRFYKPGNAMVVLAGGLPPDTRASVAKALGTVPKGERVPLQQTSAPIAGAVLTEVRTVRVQRVVRPHVGLSVPLPRIDRTPAWLVVASRLLGGGGDPERPKPAVGVRLLYMPIDRPESLTLVGSVADGEKPEEAVARMEAALARAAAPPIGSGEPAQIRQAFGFLLGLTSGPESALRANPYGVAFGLGRRRQMGLDPATLSTALDALKDDDLKALDLRAARVVIVPSR